MKAIKQFQAVPDGEFHPVTYQPGDEVPPELEATAHYFEALEGDDASQAEAKKPAGRGKATAGAGESGTKE